ncbi:hypothetical protein [Haloplanus halophilus]|uniref:hypothetical protein n=1 Tax=Haloplanus halophilus TaxID=2949993 RepID=UPI00203D09B0|nr:hypothetical protein [Haloplanus sp. GDY1]
MRNEIYRGATKLIRSRSNDALRIVFRYTQDTIDIMYIDEQILNEDLLPRIERLRTRALEIAEMSAATIITAYGELETILATHDDAIILYLLAGDDEGIIATHDRTEAPFNNELL